MIEKQGFYSIGLVERDTGIGRDTLRIWERRYGFPEPSRNARGERLYSEAQLRRLQRIRRLLDQGMRPGKLIPLGDKALDQLEVSMLPAIPKPIDAAVSRLLEYLIRGDAGQVEKSLSVLYKKHGMQEFIVKIVAPLLRTVGELWAAGRLQIYQEHFLSQQLFLLINTEIATLPKNRSQSPIVLATLPDETHTLGLLMVAGILAAQRKNVVNLGGGVPVDQISTAVKQFKASALGITFSGAYQYKHIRDHLTELRELLPANVHILTGGEGVRPLRKLPSGITKFTSLAELVENDNRLL